MEVLKKSGKIEVQGQVIYTFDDGSLSTQDLLPDALLRYVSTRNKGKQGQVDTLPMEVEGRFMHYIILGMGDKLALDHETIMKNTGGGIKACKALNLEKIVWSMTGMAKAQVALAVEALVISDYSFDKYKEKANASTLKTIFVESCEEEALEEGLALGESLVVARNLVNEPANVMTPQALAQHALDYGQAYGFEVEVLDKEAIEALGMVAYMNVAKASDNPPKFIIMKYMNAPDSDEVLAYVGKGLTFDTGGYSLKPKEGMLTMKSDMGGSAAVIGAMCALAKMGVKKNVYGLVAACENMVSGGAYRPGDIIGSRGNKSIFIQSTDAEGRLTLIDAVDYAVKDLKVTKIVDIATLTGACLVALGTTTTGVVSNDDGFYKALEEASKISGERVWRMPLFPEYKKLIQHEDADLVNSTRMAGMITAGMFIGEFVGDTPWIHMDIAGTSWTGKKNSYQSYGATGVGVKNLYYLAQA